MSSCNLTMNKSGRGYTERVLVNGTPSLLFERLKKGDLQSIPNQTIQEAIEAKVITNPNNFLERAMLLYNLALQQKSFGLDKLGEPLLDYKSGQFIPYKAIRSSLNDDRYIDNSLVGNATKVSSEAIKMVKEVKRESSNSSKNADLLYQLPTGSNLNEHVALEKTIRDLAARMSARIGIPFVVESDKSKNYKGKLENNKAYINLVYATLDTPIHEILGHPIIRAILKSNPELYQNLLKELETSRGKEVLDRIKRDYPLTKTWYNVVTRAYGISRTIETFDAIEDAQALAKQSNSYFIDKLTARGKADSYEEQQEEAIVELLGLMTAERLDNIKDGKLISLLKRLLKEMNQFIRTLFKQKEIEIKTLPDNTTLGDLANLLAYSNSKLILPNYEVIYTTPDDEKFKTYQEASNHISNLVRNIKDIDLSSIKISRNNAVQQVTDIADIKVNSFSGTDKDLTPFYAEKINGSWYISYTKETLLTEFDDDTAEPASNYTIILHYNKTLVGEHSIDSFVLNNKEYEQSKEIVDTWKQINNIKYNPEEVYSRGQEFVSIIGAYSSFDVNLMMQNLLFHIEDNQKAGGQFAVSAITKPINMRIHHLENYGGKIRIKIYPQSNDILWATNTDAYSGSVWDASEKINRNKKSELLGVSYTKYPALQNVTSVQPNLASSIENLSHKHNEVGIVLSGSNFRLEYDEDVPYATKKIIDSTNKILDQKYGKLAKPEISNASDSIINLVKLKDVLRELEREERDLFNTLDYESTDDTYAERLKNRIAEIKQKIQNLKDTENFGVRPTQTDETLKESINSIKNKIIGSPTKTQVIAKEEYDNSNEGEWTEDGVIFYKDINDEVRLVKNKSSYYKELLIQPKQKEYTSQALVNIKIAALKEVAKKYPRSLIRNEVRPIIGYEDDFDDYNELDDLFQRLPSNKEVVDTLNFTPDNPITHDLLNRAKQRFDKAGGTISNTAGIGSFYQNKHINIDPIEVAKTATRLGISINEATAQVMLHELIHFVFDGVKSSRLMELYTMYKTNRIKNGLSYEQSFDEFLARALSDKELIEELQSIDTKGKDIRIRKGGAKSILRRLIETFTRMFSPNEETSTMYADILHFYFTYSNENAPILDSTNQKLFFSGQNFVPIDLTNATLEQNLTYQKLMGVHSSGQFNEAAHTYQDANGNPLTSVTKLIEKSVGPNGEENYFKFDGDPTLYEWNREVGNQLDSILETVINGGTISQAEQVINELAARSISKKVHLSLQQIGKAYNEFRSQFSRYNSEGIVWVTQVRIFDDNAELAGTADIIGIHKDGSLSIIDLKSSVNPFNSTYSTGGFKNSYSTPFKTRDGKVKASKKTKHSAQVTIYSRMLMNLGFAITDSNPLSVKPVLITTNDTNGTKEVEDLVFEVPLIPLALSPEVAKVFKDTGRALYKTSVTDLEVFKVIDSIAVQLQRRIKQMDNEGKNSYFQKTWLNNLNNIASLEPFISFLDSLIKDLLGEQDTQKRSLPNSWKGWIDNGRKQLDAIKKGTAHSSYSNSFAKLNELITALELYMPILNATDNLLSKFEDNARIEVNSVLNQIRIAKSKAISLLNDLKEESINLLAENMSNATDTTEVSESEDLNLIAIAEEISRLEELEQSGTLSRLDKLRLSKARKRRDRRLKTYDNKRISTDKDGKVAVDKKYSSTIDEFKALLGGERKDVSFLEATTISAIMSSSKVLATFAKIVKEEFEKTRISLIKVRKNLGKEFNAYLASTNINRNNVAAFNKPFYEIINVFNSQTKEITKKVFFKSEINWNLYYENLAKLTAELDAKVEAKVITISERNSKLSEWYKANQEVNLEDITMKDPITGKEVVMFRGINSIVAQKRQELEDTFGKATVYNSATKSYELRSELEYSKWVLKNTYEDKVTKERVWMIPEIKLPVSSKYRKQLNMSAEEARFHSSLVYTYLEAQLNVPIGKRMGLQIPSIPKNSNDRWRELMRDKGVLEGSKGYISKEVDETIGALDSRHEEKYGTNDGNSLPVLYSNREIKLEDVSLDLTSSVLRYTAMAKNYKSRSKLLPMANSLLKTLETNRPLKTDSNGNKFLSLISKVSGKKLYEESKKDHTLEALDSFIKTQFYLQPRKLEDDMLSPKQQRIVDMLTKFMSITSVSILKPLSNLANALTAETNVLIESFVTQHISLPSWMKTNTLVLDVEKDFITDFNSVYPTTLWKMFFDLYDPVQGTFNDNLGRKMTHSQAKRAWSTDTLFLGQKRGEFQAQMRLAMSVLNEFQVFTLANPNDKIPMLDALEVRNGELKLKAGYGYMINGRFVSNPFNQQLQHKIHGLNKLLHGIYNSFDRVSAERDSVGRLLLLYRKFLPAGLRRRWGNSGQLNVELGDREFADYRALTSMLTYIVTDLKNFKKYLDPSNTDLILHPNEIYAARRAFAELATIAALGIMLSVLFRLKDLDDDEEKDWFLDASTYSLFRLMTEVSTFVHPFSLYRSFRSPSAIYGIVTKTVTLIQQALQDLFNMELEEYKQDSGLARKGDSKLFHNFLKMLNLNGVTVDPQLGLDILELQVNK